MRSIRNITLYVIIFCIVSLFKGLPFAEAYPDPEANDFAYTTALANRNGAYGQKAVWKDRYDEAYALVQALLNQWSSNEQAIKDDTWDTVDAATATLIAEMVRRANTDSSDEMEERVVEYLPILFGKYQTAKKAISTVKKTAKRADYLLALNDAVGVLDEVHAENQKAFNNYEEKYDVYLKIMVEHIDGLARVPNHSPEGDYSSVTAWSLDDVKTEVKAKDAFRLTDSQNKFMFWYHPGDLRSSSNPTNHTIDRFYHFGLWKRKELPSDQLCGGDCGRQFQTPVEHLVICPHALVQDAQIPDGKVAPAGCNRAYYTCKKSDTNEHRVRLCSKKKKNDFFCNEPYRKCSNSNFQHKYMKTKHSDAAWGFKYGPLLGIYNATPGSSHTAELTTPAAYDWVKWYVASPGESGRGSLIETDNGDGTTTTASMTYTFPQSLTGDYVIMAVVPDETEEDNEVFYTVSVSVSATTSPAALVTCDIEGCTLQTPYDPNDTVAAALHAYCDGCFQYKCNGRTHVEEQCTNTNANGDRCTYTFWRCLHPTVPSYGPSHTCTYPVAPAPAVFTPVLTLTYNSSTGAVSLTATANQPIYGADLYVSSPGDARQYGTKIGWTSGNSNRTTYSLPVSYTFPSTAASGTYKFTLRVYPFNDSGSGDPWGTPYDVFKNVTVQ